MKKSGLSVIFLLGLLLSFSFVIAELDLPAPPPAPGVDSGNVNQTNYSTQDVYPGSSGNVVNNDLGVTGDKSSSLVYWASFVGVIILICLLAMLILFIIRKNRGPEMIVPGSLSGKIDLKSVKK